LHDRAGNQTSGPKPGDETTGQHYKWAAWNRLVAAYGDDNGEPRDLLATCRYDGLNRRIQKVVQGDPDATYDYYYNGSWQVLETREGAGAPESLQPKVQYVWSQRYIDSPVLRDRDTTGNDELDETLYYATDANFNVTALTDTGGRRQASRSLATSSGTAA